MGKGKGVGKNILVTTMTSDLIIKHKSLCKYFAFFRNSEQATQKYFGKTPQKRPLDGPCHESSANHF